MINFDSYLPIPLHQQNGFINKITSGNIDIRLSYCDQFQYVHIYKTQKQKTNKYMKLKGLLSTSVCHKKICYWF